MVQLEGLEMDLINCIVIALTSSAALPAFIIKEPLLSKERDRENKFK